MTNIKSILINTVILGVLVFAIMSFIIIIQINSDVPQKNRITNNTLINESYGELEASLQNQKDAENALDALEDLPPTVGNCAAVFVAEDV